VVGTPLLQEAAGQILQEIADVGTAPVVLALIVFEPVPASGEQFPDGVPPAVDAVLPVVV
jgi:hypothetical protein